MQRSIENRASTIKSLTPNDLRRIIPVMVGIDQHPNPNTLGTANKNGRRAVVLRVPKSDCE